MNHPPVTLIDATAVLKELEAARVIFDRAAAVANADGRQTVSHLYTGKVAGISHAISTIKIAQADAYATAVKEGEKQSDQRSTDDANLYPMH